MKKLIVYIDGFNLYHAIDDLKKPSLKWLNYWTLGNTFLERNEKLIAVNFFTAVLNWDANKQKRHVNYIKAQRASGVTVHEANFKKAKRVCRETGRTCRLDEVKYIHIARDGRDACMSYHNHVSNFTADTLARLDREGLEDKTIGRPYPRASKDPAQFFRSWISKGEVPGHTDGSPFVSFFALERTYWSERNRPNFLLLHYNDLKVDLRGEMQKIANFLNIEIPNKLWPQLIEAASFEAMRRDGAKIAPGVTRMFENGAETFFFKASNGRWREVLVAEDLALYDAKVRENFSRNCATWLEHGREGGADPSALPS